MSTYQNWVRDWDLMVRSHLSAELLKEFDACWVRPTSWGPQWVTFRV